MKINSEWHRANRMPANPTKDQRYRWHIEHAKHCGCRKMPDQLKLEIAQWEKTRKIS